MASPTLNLVIDARPRGPRGLLAAEVVLGRAVLSRLVEQALEAIGPGGRLAVRCLPADRDELAPLLAEAGEGRVEITHAPDGPEVDIDQWVFQTGGQAFLPVLNRAATGKNACPPGGLTTAENGNDRTSTAAVLRTDRLYDSRRLRKILHRGGEPEAAVIWRLDRPEAIEAAEQELTRRFTYQPIGRHWAFPIAQRIAGALAPTRVRPNAVTLAAAALMFLGIAIVAYGGAGWIGRAVTGGAFAAALVLDTADGRLARLQGTSSEFGRWLDEVLDELADLSLHGAIAWMMFRGTGQALWLALGMVYASGKYMFVIQSLSGASMERAQAKAEPTIGIGREGPSGTVAPARRLVAALGHADLRWHLWIVLALVGRLDAALSVYALYFPFRAAAGIARKGVARA